MGAFFSSSIFRAHTCLSEEQALNYPVDGGKYDLLLEYIAMDTITSLG